MFKDFDLYWILILMFIVIFICIFSCMWNSPKYEESNIDFQFENVEDLIESEKFNYITYKINDSLYINIEVESLLDWCALKTAFIDRYYQMDISYFNDSAYVITQSRKEYRLE